MRINIIFLLFTMAFCGFAVADDKPTDLSIEISKVLPDGVIGEKIFTVQEQHVIASSSQSVGLGGGSSVTVGTSVRHTNTYAFVSVTKGKGQYTEGQQVTFYASRSGTYNNNSQVIEKWIAQERPAPIPAPKPQPAPFNPGSMNDPVH